MANYKPLKLTFDLDDEYQKAIYDYIKERSNQSSYIRSLVHSDMRSKQPASEPLIIDYKDEIVESKIEKVEYIAVPDPPLKLKSIVVEDDELDLDGMF
jgi:hypothetical protein